MGEASKENPFSEQFELSPLDEDLITAYRAVNHSVDNLAYTSDFDKLYKMFREAGHDLEKNEVFRRLLILRKSGLLPRLFWPTETSTV